MNNDKIQQFVTSVLTARLNEKSRAFCEKSVADITTGVSEARFSQLIAIASRHARRTSLALSDEERAMASLAVPGWDPVEWNLLETLRAFLILVRPDLHQESFTAAFENWFQYADEGESCAFYRVIPLLPQGQRFVWRAGEGCRSNMTSVFRAVACDSPYPLQYFGEITWQQMIMKALFIGVPVWRIHGLDQRLTPTLATMLLDYIDERISAGRTIPVDAWLLLGPHWSDRAASAVEGALGGDPASRRAAALALARAGQHSRLAQWLASEADPAVCQGLPQVLGSQVSVTTYQHLLSEGNNHAVF